MFVKVGISLNKKESPGSFSLVATSNNNRIVIAVDNSVELEEDTEISVLTKEDVLEVEDSSDDITLTILFDGQFTESRTIHVNPYLLEKGKNHLLEPISIQGAVVKANVSILERLPTNWFDNGIAIIGEESRPWYLKAEDLYKFTKALSQKVQSPTLIHAANEIFAMIDMVSIKVSTNMLFINLDEGFSAIASIDSALDSLFVNCDNSVDSVRFNIALRLHHLRKALTGLIQQLSAFQTATDLGMKEKVKALQEKNTGLLEALSTAIEWASVKSENATAWVTQEKQEAINKLKAVHSSGTQSLAQAHSSLLSAPLNVYNCVAAQYSKVSTQVSDTLDDAQEALKALPATAQPYVQNAVGATQPYVATVLTNATPYIETFKSTPFVEHLILDTKDTIQKHEAVNSLVSTVLTQASAALDEVTQYCTDDRYYEDTTSIVAPYQDSQNVVINQDIVVDECTIDLSGPIMNPNTEVEAN